MSDDEKEHWLGPVIDVGMTVLALLVSVGAPIWAIIHFWPKAN